MTITKKNHCAERQFFSAKYFSHEFDHEGKVGATPIEIRRAELKGDGKTVRLEVEGQEEGFVTWFRLPLIISAEGEELREDTFWYTLNRVPGRF